MATRSVFPLRNLSGGRNGYDAPVDLPDDQCVEALNVEWRGTSFARKRNGAAGIASTDGTDEVYAALRYVPTTASSAELWLLRGASSLTFTRFHGASVSTVTPDDTPDSVDMSGATLNGRMALMYGSNVGRAHMILTGGVLRRMGLPMLLTGAFATTDATQAGSITDTRKYKFRLIEKSGSTILRRSEANAPTNAVTLSAKEYSATVTAAGSNLPDEGETHWELYAASITNDYATYHYVGEAALDAPITDDEATLTGDVEALAGTYSLPPAAEFVVTSGARFVMAGDYSGAADGDAFAEIAPKTNRVWWTPVLGDLDVSDDERILDTVEVKGYLDVDEKITGLGSGEGGIVFVFSERSIWQLTPTGNNVAPFVRTDLTRTVGTFSHDSIINGEDEHGRPALYFMSARGPYRLGIAGLEWLGHDIQDLMVNVTTDSAIAAHGVYHAEKRQIWWWVRDITLPVFAGFTTRRLVFDVARGRRVTGKGVVGGWATHTGESCIALCSVMFANTIGASMSYDLKPYIGYGGADVFGSGTECLWKCDSDDDEDDNGSAFQAYIQTKPYQLAGPYRLFVMTEPTVLARAATGVSVRVSCIRDFGLETRTADVSLTASAASETHVTRKLDDSAMEAAAYLALRVGDASAVETGWTIDLVEVPWEPRETR